MNQLNIKIILVVDAFDVNYKYFIDKLKQEFSHETYRRVRAQNRFSAKVAKFSMNIEGGLPYFYC